MGDAALVAVNATLGGKNPLVVLVTSNLADASGLFVPIPTCAFIVSPVKNKDNSRSSFVFISNDLNVYLNLTLYFKRIFL
jgi:hypothetical protein